ncbi:MAG: alpha-amylase family protein [Planctomycetota bacterium]
MLERLLLLILMLSAGAGRNDAAGKERSISERIAARDFPSAFQAWGRADNLRGEDELFTVARHDLLWHVISWYGLVWDKSPAGLGEAFRPESIEKGLDKRKKLLELNPNLILIAEIRYRDASRRFLPADHKWWRRNDDGKLTKGWSEGKFIQLDFDNPEYRAHVAHRARAVVESGVVDGVLLDWWRDDDSRLELVKMVRKAIGDKHLIITNPNDRTTPRTAPYINGYFMECYRSKTPKDWQRIAATLKWAEMNLRPPRVNCLETWFHNSREDLNLMRATTALSLTCSDGYCLFSDPNPLPTGDHRHNWYPFWSKSLGKPTSEGVTMPDGTIRRQFENDTAVYNPRGNKTVTVTFDQPKTSTATGKTSRTHTLKSPDGDIYLKANVK